MSLLGLMVIKSVGASGRPIAEADITNGFSSASIELTCIDDNQTTSWKLIEKRCWNLGRGNSHTTSHKSLNLMIGRSKLELS
jgi:hypothetical protein